MPLVHLKTSDTSTKTQIRINNSHYFFRLETVRFYCLDFSKYSSAMSREGPAYKFFLSRCRLGKVTFS